MKTLEQQIASLQLHPHQHHPQSRTISPQRQPQQPPQQQPHSPLYDNTSDHHKTFSNSPQQRSYNNNYHNIYNNDVMLQQENNNNNNNRNLLGSGDSSAMMTHSPIHWIGFNDLNNMSCPFSSSKSGRMMSASSMSSASSSSSTLPANESWMTEDADQVQIICRLRDCTEDDIGVDVFDDHGACLKVYKRSSASSVLSQPRNLAQPFDKVFALPRDTNPDAMKRSVDQNGQLIISIPKM